MGVHQYCDHAGMRDGRSMSGARLWAEAEAQREADYRNGQSNKWGAEIALLRQIADPLASQLPRETSIIELGPGTLNAFRQKTVPLIRALHSPRCVIVDKSPTFLKDIKLGELTKGIDIEAVEEDFFVGARNLQDKTAPTLMCAFGGIISNLISPLDDKLPDDVLTATLRSFSKVLNAGWVLLTFDSSEDGEAISAYYEKHALFQLNIFDRMAVEFSMEGNFDPVAFDYATEWRAASNQLAHMAVLNRDLTFTIQKEKFHFSKGQSFHIKNSYKYAPEFLEECCGRAQLTVVQRWNKEDSWCYLLKKV